MLLVLSLVFIYFHFFTMKETKNLTRVNILLIFNFVQGGMCSKIDSYKMATYTAILYINSLIFLFNFRRLAYLQQR